MKQQITGQKAYELNCKRGILVSKEDIDLLYDHLWYISDQGYPKTNYKTEDNKRTNLNLHRIVAVRMGLDPTLRIVFKDSDRKNCGRENLIGKTCGEIEISKDRENIKRSGFTGIYWETYFQRWKVRLRDPVTRKYRSNGSYKNLEGAIKALEELKIELYGYNL